MSRLARLAAFVGLVLLTPAPARANPLDAFGFGSRAIGLAGAYTALADDFSANYYNPAALAAGERLRLELGYVYSAPVLRIDGADVGVDASRGFQGGLVLAGDLLGRRIAASVGMFLPDRLISRIRSLPQRQPRFVLFDNRPQRIVISTSVAVQVLEHLYVGAGLSFLANTKGVLDMSGEVAFFDAENTRLFSAVDVDLKSIRYPTVGILFEPAGGWRLGLTLREEFSLRLDIDVVVRGDIISDFDPDDPQVLVEDGAFVLVSGNNNLFSPRQLALGVAYELGCWVLTADLTWVQWSHFPTPTATVDIDLDLGALGDQFRIPPIDRPIPAGFHDIFVPRFGAEYTPLDGEDFGLTLRGGYGWEPSPAPEQPVATNYIDTDKHTFAVGASLRFPGLAPIMERPLIFDVAGSLVWLPERTYRKAAAADPIGDYRADGLVFTASATLKLLF